MILKHHLDWKASELAGGKRKAKIPASPDPARRILAFSKLSGHEGLSTGTPHFIGGSFSFYWLETAEHIEAGSSVGFEESALIYESEQKAEGAEVFSPFNFLPLDVSYKIEYSADGSEALISAQLEIFSFSSATIFASLSVDGLELLPSARVSLEKGRTAIELRPVKLVRQRGLWPSASQEASIYQMGLDLGLSSELVVRDVREITIWNANA